MTTLIADIRNDGKWGSFGVAVGFVLRLGRLKTT